MSRYDVSVGVKIGVLDSPLKKVKNGKFYNCENNIIIVYKHEAWRLGIGYCNVI